MQSISKIPPFGLRMPNEVKRWVEGEAVRSDRSMNYTIVKILEDAMKSAAEDKFEGMPSTAYPLSN